ncbi:hypothetical protein [Nocardia sp. XZ_19_385]|uniref:hypothetical protein n=1 Tax=Nocardia sp. XZ_19_385 TaxID=2769488 RepID=UPI00188FF1E3|nr:hypothetical protein [Nocardia sp. XZ_19_385]
MSTAIRETTSPSFHDLGIVPVDLDAAPRPGTVSLVRRPHRTGLRTVDSAPRPLADRRPRDSRPSSAEQVYRRPVRTSAMRPPHGTHPMDTRVAEAQVGFAVLAVAALLSALVVTALILLAQWRAGTFGVQPATTPVVVEQLPAAEPGLVR